MDFINIMDFLRCKIILRATVFRLGNEIIPRSPDVIFIMRCLFIVAGALGAPRALLITVTLV